MALLVFVPLNAGAVTTADFERSRPLWEHPGSLGGFSVVEDVAFVGLPLPSESPKPKVVRIVLTAYTSSPDETDDTPFITASGVRVRDGIVATNALPIGTQVRIPKLYGEKIFVVEDRMHSRYKDRMDIWMPSKREALRFGKVMADVEVLHEAI